MSPKDNEAVIQKLIQAINSKQVELMDELFHENAIMDWPQSGEQIVGGDNRRSVYGAFPSLPTITPKRMLSAGDLVIAEALMDYGGNKTNGVFIFEFKDGKIAKETAYWADPFKAPAWRSKWVTKT